MAKSKLSLRGVDLFCGPGGFTIGCKRAGVSTICAVDHSADAIETFRRHTRDADVFCKDISAVDFSDYLGAVDLVYGGPPCQPFSNGGHRRGASDQRNMIPAFLDVVRCLSPAMVVMENVPGLASRSRISYLFKILSDLADLGYRPNCRILNAADYGVPQKRRRLFIVAFRERPFWFPRPTHGPEGRKPWVPAKAVVSARPLGEPPNCRVVFARSPDLRRSPYAGHVYNGQGRPIDPTSPCPTILASSGGYKTNWVDTDGIAVKYHRHLASGGEPWVGEVPGARRLTVDESALIQSFPKRMRFAGSKSSQYTQIGDAVPPVLAERLCKEIVAQHSGKNPNSTLHYPPDPAQTRFW